MYDYVDWFEGTWSCHWVVPKQNSASIWMEDLLGNPLYAIEFHNRRNDINVIQCINTLALEFGGDCARTFDQWVWSNFYAAEKKELSNCKILEVMSQALRIGLVNSKYLMCYCAGKEDRWQSKSENKMNTFQSKFMFRLKTSPTFIFE